MRLNPPYYHVRITQKSARTDEVKLDFNESQLKEKFLKPYKEGRPIVISGKTIPPDDIERIRINRTEKNSDELLPKIKRERRNKSGFVAVGIPDEWYVADEGEDVTDEFITAPPGSGGKEEDIEKVEMYDERNVFVVHGRNLKIQESMYEFLQAIDLRPIKWSQARKATGTPSPYIGDILEKAFSISQAVVVLMTPDEEVRLRHDSIDDDDHQYEKEERKEEGYQARPNVLFEAGMAMAKSPENTVIVEIGNLRPFSDIGGRHVVRFDGSTKTRQELAERLRDAGCPVNTSGTDWDDAGDFEINQD